MGLARGLSGVAGTFYVPVSTAGARKRHLMVTGHSGRDPAIPPGINNSGVFVTATLFIKTGRLHAVTP